MHPHLGYVEGVTVYKRDVVVRRRKSYRPNDPPPRGSVVEFSYKSRQRLAFVAANTDVVFQTMVTFTYPKDFPTDGEQVKRNWHDVLVWMRREFGSFSYLWFLEFQHRGAPHFHLLTDWPMPLSREQVKGVRFRIASTWYRIVGSGDPKHLSACTRTDVLRSSEGGARYAVKYALKMYQKQVPEAYQNVGRFWGCSRDAVPTPRSIVRCTEDDIRGALQGWKWAPLAKQELYTVLYGCADRFAPEDTTNG